MSYATTILPAPSAPSAASGRRATEATPLQTGLTTVHEPQALALPAPFLKTLGVSKGRLRQFFYVEVKAETLVLRTLDDHLQTTLVPRLRDVPRSQVLAAAALPEFSALARRILDLPEAELEPGGTLRIPEKARRLPAGRRLRLCLVDPFPASKRPAPPWRLWLFIADEDLPGENSAATVEPDTAPRTHC